MGTLLEIMRYPSLLSDEQINEFETAATSFCNQWIQTGRVGKFGSYGYGKLTPYMHCLVDHVPDQMRVFGCLAIVNCQGTCSVFFSAHFASRACAWVCA